MEALALEMRPYVWQACVASADVLAAAGREDEAQAKRIAARVIIEEIGGMLNDPTLRQAYLESALPKAAG